MQLAEKFFDWQMNGSVFARDAALAVDDISALQERPAYDHIIHDVFSGATLVSVFAASARTLTNYPFVFASTAVLTPNFRPLPAPTCGRRPCVHSCRPVSC